MIVRLYRPSDLPEWLRMRELLWPGSTADPDDAGAWLSRSDAAVIVAERPGTTGLLGFAEVGARPYADGCETSPVAFLEGWYVDPDSRRTGVATALALAVEAWAIEHGFAELASDALQENVISQEAHLANGFEEVERSVKYRKTLGLRKT